VRQFLAIELDARTRAALADLQASLKRSCPGWRWIDPAGVHLTLRFLGEVDAETDERARPLWRRAAGRGRAFRCEAGGVGVFPPRERPRVLWVGVHERGDAGVLGGLAADLEADARSLGFPPETRRFRPHLTVARARKDERPVRPDGVDDLSLAEFPVDAVTLFRSRLGPGGARYDVLEAFPLARGSAEEAGA